MKVFLEDKEFILFNVSLEILNFLFCFFNLLTRVSLLISSNDFWFIIVSKFLRLGNSLIKFKGNIILSTHDFEFANSVGNRIIEIGPKGFIDKLMSFEDYLNDKKVEELRNKIY